MQKKKKRGLTLAVQPWRIHGTFAPIDSLLDQIEKTGMIDVAQGDAVLKDLRTGHYVRFVPEFRGLIAFFEIARNRHAWPIETAPLTRLANKLHTACPITAEDIAASRASCSALRRYVPRLTMEEANDIVNTVKIRAALQAKNFACNEQKNWKNHT